LNHLKEHVPQKLREDVSLSYLRKGILHGAEYLNLTGKRDFEIWGVENQELYQKALTAYRSIADKRESILKYLAEVGRTLNTLKPRIYNDELLTFDQVHDQYLKEEIALTDYYSVLTQTAHDQDISLKNFTHLKFLKKLKNLESKINFNKANLRGVEFTKTKFFDVDLSGSNGLTQAQIDKSCVDERTKLPVGLKRPDPCP